MLDTNQTAVAIQGSLKANAESLIEEAQKNPSADVDSSAFDFTSSENTNTTVAAPPAQSSVEKLKEAAHAKLAAQPSVQNAPEASQVAT